MEHPPRIVLVRPQMGENIGAAARAMMNFGLSDLWIVAPRDGWPNPKAHEMSARAKEIIERATVVETLNDALHGMHIAYGSSARRRDISLPFYDVPDMPQWWVHNHGLKTALIFGPENNGLSNEDLTHCSALITIPADPRNTSLNLAQSVVVIAYAWFQMHHAFVQHPPLTSSHSTVATIDERTALYDAWWALLDQASYGAKHPEKRQSAQQHLRIMLGQCMLHSHEVQMLHGMVRALSEHPKTILCNTFQ